MGQGMRKSRGKAQRCFAPATETILPFACGVVLFAVTACQPQILPAPTPMPVATFSPAAAVPSATPVTLQPTWTATPFRVPTITPNMTLTPRPDITEIAGGLGSPDDLALMPDGSILYSDESGDSVRRILPTGQVMTLVRGVEAPEGIVVLPDGSLLIAEQRRNRIVHFEPGKPLTTWLSLRNSGGGLGVDGIARDSRNGDIIIPDSPNGRVLRVDAQGKNERVIASGLIRPTGAAVAPDGSLLIADETGDQVYRLLSGGRTESLGRFAMPDDVAVDANGNVFVASLADNSIRTIDAQTRTVRLMATVQGPQGIAIEPDGSVIISEPARHRLLRLHRSY